MPSQGNMDELICQWNRTPISMCRWPSPHRHRNNFLHPQVTGPQGMKSHVWPYFHGNMTYESRNTLHHRWEFSGNYPLFAIVMLIYHYVERIWRIIVTPFFGITYTIMNKYYPGEPVNIHIRSLINIILENNRVITTKKSLRFNYH